MARGFSLQKYEYIRVMHPLYFQRMHHQWPHHFSYEHHLCDTCGDIRCNLWLFHCLIRLFAIFAGLCF